MIPKLKAELFAPEIGNHCEGPFWDSQLESTFLVDMLDGAVVQVTMQGTTRRISVPNEEVVSMVRRKASGGHIVVGCSRIFDTNLDSQDPIFTLRADLQLSPDVRSNEGCCSPSGDIYVGTMRWDAADAGGAVYAVSAGGFTSVALPRTTISNGMRFLSEDQVVFIDSPTKSLVRYNVDKTKTWTKAALVADLDFGAQSPDGLCLDVDGGYWVAFWDGGCVRRFSKDGALTHEVFVPVSRPTSCTFIGPDLNTLAITSSRYEIRKEDEPLAGSLFLLETTFNGAPDYEAV